MVYFSKMLNIWKIWFIFLLKINLLLGWQWQRQPGRRGQAEQRRSNDDNDDYFLIMMMMMMIMLVVMMTMMLMMMLIIIFLVIMMIMMMLVTKGIHYYMMIVKISRCQDEQDDDYGDSDSDQNDRLNNINISSKKDSILPSFWCWRRRLRATEIRPLYTNLFIASHTFLSLIRGPKRHAHCTANVIHFLIWQKYHRYFLVWSAGVIDRNALEDNDFVCIYTFVLVVLSQRLNTFLIRPRPNGRICGQHVRTLQMNYCGIFSSRMSSYTLDSK